MPSVIVPVKCSKCGEVIVFEITAPSPGGTKSFSFDCPNGHLATNADGGCEVVDLTSYDQTQLKRVLL